MSSLRNAVQRRNHRERAQPQERAKWGLLEKRKDYKLRAADHKTKKRKINALKNKASERNEDEFYFGMMSSTTERGIKRSKRHEGNSGGGGKVLDEDVVKLMKTQDQGYLQTMLQRTVRERERLEEEVLLADTGVGSAPNKSRIIFDDFGTNAAQLDRQYSELGVVSENDELEDIGEAERHSTKQGVASVAQQDEMQRKQHRIEVRRRKLDALMEQEAKLSAALHEVDEQRAKMSRAIGGVNKQGIKFKQRERKR